MAEDRIGKDAVALVAAAFFVSILTEKFVTYAVLPTCYLPVTYSPIFAASHGFSGQIPVFLSDMEKVPQPLEITVLSSLPAFLFTRYI